MDGTLAFTQQVRADRPFVVAGLGHEVDVGTHLRYSAMGLNGQSVQVQIHAKPPLKLELDIQRGHGRIVDIGTRFTAVTDAQRKGD